MKYIKKPIPVEISEPWMKSGDDPDVFDWRQVMGDKQSSVGLIACYECGKQLQVHGQIKTLEGYHIVCPGDRIVTGVEGERYPIKPNIFAKTYKPYKGKHSPGETQEG